MDLRIQLFIDALKKDPELEDWQITQADNAIKLYIVHFLSASADTVELSSNSIELQNKFPDDQEIIKKVREVLRIRHYAYSTERAYTDWFKRFHNYLTIIKKIGQLRALRNMSKAPVSPLDTLLSDKE